MTNREAPPQQLDETEETPTPPSNRDRLRSHLRPDGLALKLLDAWKEDDPQAQARMLAALHDFHRAK
jgi:hypothetical protein